MFEDYFYRGFGVPIHPFPHGLIEYYAITLCNLGLNSILHVSVSIHFYDAYLGILPHFDLFRHFFCLKSHGDLDLGLWVVHTCSCGIGWLGSTSLPH